MVSMKYTGFISLAFLACLLNGLYCYAQHYIFKTYTVEDGLVSNPVRRIYQDAKGFIWIGTWEGLSKYDGHRFTNFTIVNGLSHNLINDLFESDERLYVAENNGSIDILQQDIITTKKLLPDVVINQFYKMPDRRVIAATDSSGFYELIGNRLIKPSQEFEYATYNDMMTLNDSFLIAGSEGPIHILNMKFQAVSKIEQPKEVVTFKIFKDSKNRVWIGTNYGLRLLVEKRDKENKITYSLLYDPIDITALKNNLISDMLEDQEGNFWICSTHGLFKIDVDGGWQVFREKDGLPSANITSIYQDKEKNLWIGTYLGLAKLTTKNGIYIYTVDNTNGINNIGTLVPRSDNSFLANSATGIKSFDFSTKKFTNVSYQKEVIYTGYVQNSYPLLFYRNDNNFGVYDSSMQRIRENAQRTDLKSEVYCSVMDKDGNIFNGTQKGLVVLHGKVAYYESKIPHRVTALLIDQAGNLWVATWGNGVYKVTYSKNNLNDISVQNLSKFIPDNNIRSLSEDLDGNIWVGTRYQGIVRLKKNKGSFESQCLDLHSGLMSNWIRTMGQDKKGNIWIGSNLGIDKLIPSGDTFRVFNFSRTNNYFASINEIITKHKSLWMSTSHGLINIVDGESENNPPPNVFITTANVGDTSYRFHSNNHGKVHLKYNQNKAMFEFSAPAFINEKQILYSYRLLGATDTTWSRPYNIHTVSYANLQPGSYRFEVRTRGWNDQWGNSESFSFEIQPPYWKKWWFYLLLGCLALLFLYGIYRYRIRQLVKVQQVRNRIASDLHDDIGSTLTNINMLSEISRKNLESPKEAGKFLQRISEEVTSTSQALNDIIWSVNSRYDSMEEILTRMRRYAADLFDNSNTNFVLTVDETLTSKKIGMELRRDIYLVYKELMNNIVKHAAAKNVIVHAKIIQDTLQLKIADDGTGYNQHAITDRNGLKNIRARINKWGGSQTVNTSPGNGTVIDIIFPLAG